MNLAASVKTIHNGGTVYLTDIPLLSEDEFCRTILDATDHGWRVASYFGVPEGDEVTLYAVLGYKQDGIIAVLRTRVRGSFPSLASLCPQVQLFEREILEQCGIVPEGHPWLKPVRFAPSVTVKGARPVPGEMEFYRVEGDEVHEVAVGPVHAGIIEPGHFRFQCHSEEVFHLEISLGYQHRGIEAGLVGGPHPATLYQLETTAGDTTIGHTEAYCMVMEALTGRRVPARGEALRGIALELERLANHTGDLGAIAGDVGYLPTASFCGRIRGDFLNMTALLCGSRFGRGLVRPGGTGFDCIDRQRDDLLLRIAAARKDLTVAVELLWSSPSVMARLEKTGTVSFKDAEELGLVGPAMRASGGARDIRKDFPFGIYRMKQIPAVTTATGDVYARALIRWLEAERSLDFIEELLRQLPGGKFRSDVLGSSPPAPDMLAVALTEGWRGRICHVALTDSAGHFRKYKITDPSFHNWSGLALALRGEQISDFPLCNKSFNLSYCGFDL
jgi:Ni,Fe-hydrogenase III large subunit